MKLKLFYNQLSAPVKFILSGIALYLLWILLYEGLIRPHGWIDPFLTRIVSEHSVNILRLIGYDASDKIINRSTIVYNGTTGVLQIDYICDGLILYIIFLIFMLSFPGRIINKLWYIPASFILIYLINLLRVVSLVIIQIHHPSWLYFNHKYTFTIIVYGLIFFLWLVWVNKFSSRKKTGT